MPAFNSDKLMPLVRKLAIRSSLEPADAEALFGLPHRLALLDPGVYIVREGDIVDSCALLLSGYAHRSKMGLGGSRQILAFHMRGDLLDLQNSLLEVADHSVQALTCAEVAFVPRSAIAAVVEKRPGIARAFWRDTLADASIFREWILNLGRRDARQRISHLTCEIVAMQQQAGICAGPSYAWPFTQEQIADATGLTPVHVNRVLQAMRADGVISTGQRVLIVHDWARLKAAAGFNPAYLHFKGAGQGARLTA